MLIYFSFHFSLFNRDTEDTQKQQQQQQQKLTNSAKYAMPVSL